MKFADLPVAYHFIFESEFIAGNNNIFLYRKTDRECAKNLHTKGTLDEIHPDTKVRLILM